MKTTYYPENLEELVAYMEQKGIRFSSKKYDPKNRYAIMGGGTSVRILGSAQDGINGIVLFCHRDKEDVNRICEKYRKEVFPNSESTRPYKISITEDELDGVIEILLKNDLNNKTRQENHPQPQQSDERKLSKTSEEFLKNYTRKLPDNFENWSVRAQEYWIAETRGNQILSQ